MKDLNTNNDEFIDEEDGESLEDQIKVLRRKFNSFTKWKIIITLYMIASFGIIMFLFYALFNHITR